MSGDFRAMLRSIVGGRDLPAAEMAYAIGAMVDATWTPVQSAGFLGALAAKGEVASEIVGAVEAIRARGVHLEHAIDLVVDTCGTGGDGAHTINVSTAAAFVLAGCGLHVAKHGNRAASSLCGSADVLEACGIAIDAPPELSRIRLERDRFAFLFAPLYHGALREIAPVRRELGVRTVFNVLGPLANPARATHQVIGVAAPAHLELVGQALLELGTHGGAVVHAESGIDEVAGDVPTRVFQFGPSGTRRWRLDPADYGISAPSDALAGGPPAFNAAALRSILEGERSPRADVVALNAALLLLVAERVADMTEGVALARRSLADGSAHDVFDRLRRPTELEFA